MLQIWRQLGHRQLSLHARWASTGRPNFEERPLLQQVDEQDGAFQGRQHQGGRRHHPVHRLPAPLPVPRRRPAAEDRQPHVAARPLQGRGLGGQPASCSTSACRTSSTPSTCSTPRPGIVRDVIMGRIKLPSQDAMRKDSADLADARGEARGCRADDLVPGRLCEGADRRHGLSDLRHRGHQPDLHGVGAPQDARTSWPSATMPTAR